MADIYLTPGDAKRALLEANRDYYGRKTWQQAFGGIDLAEQQQLGSLQYDYSKAIGKAYAAAHKNQQSIMSSNLGQGFKEQAMLSNEEALAQAFETYRQNYLSSISNVEKEATAARTELGEQLTTQAENVASFLNAPFGTDTEEGYIQWLYNKFEESDKYKGKFATDPTFARYMKEENGQQILKTSDEIRTMLREEGGTNLSAEATNIYDQLFNLGATYGEEYGYGRWLSETNPELYDWAKKGDIYNFTAAGTNLGTIKELVGMKSTDQVYDYVDMMTGIPKEVIEENKNNLQTKFNDLYKSIELLNKNGNEYNTKEVKKKYEELLVELEKITKDFGEKDSDINKLFNKLKSTSIENINELNKQFGNNTFIGKLFNSVKDFVSFKWSGSKKADSASLTKQFEDFSKTYNQYLLLLTNINTQQNIRNNTINTPYKTYGAVGSGEGLRSGR